MALRAEGVDDDSMVDEEHADSEAVDVEAHATLKSDIIKAVPEGEPVGGKPAVSGKRKGGKELLAYSLLWRTGNARRSVAVGAC